MDTLDAIKTLWTLKQRYALSWGMALFEGIQGLREYERLDERFRQEQDARHIIKSFHNSPY